MFLVSTGIFIVKIRSYKMKPPENVTVYDAELATMWFAEEGILCVVSKNVERTQENHKAHFDLVSKLSGGKKVCIVADISLSASMDKKTREQSADEVPKVFKAMAIISNSAFSRFFANLYMGLIKQTIPIRLVETEEEAIVWLRQFVEFNS
jgi:hypothetical protein